MVVVQQLSNPPQNEKIDVKWTLMIMISWKLWFAVLKYCMIISYNGKAILSLLFIGSNQ